MTAGRGMSRRAALRATLLAAAGGATGPAGGPRVENWLGWDRPPVSGGYAAAADNLDAAAQTVADALVEQ